MNIQELFIQTNQALNDIVVQVKPEQLELKVTAQAAYLDGQTLRTTINVCAYENLCVPRMLAGEKDIPTNDTVTDDYLKSDVVANYTALTDSANRAVRECKDLDQMVHMSYATVPASDYLKDIVVQRSTTAFDIAKFAGISFQWSDELVKAIRGVIEPNAVMLREYGVFPPVVELSEGASPQDELIAMTGRQP